MNDHFGSGDAQKQSTNDEAKLHEQPLADDVDKEERDDPPDWEKMEVGLYFELIADMLTKIYRNGAWIVLYKIYAFSQKRWIWLVLRATKTHGN